MKTAVEIILILTAAVVPALIWAVWYLGRPIPVSMQNRPQPVPVRTDMVSNRWTLVLQDLHSGELVRKTFINRVLLGRRINGAAEQQGLMYLSNDATISRRQCAIEEKDNRIVIRNLSGTNITTHNGNQLMYTDTLCPGDYIGIGVRNYRVLELNRS